jgi:hypothetical protein
MPLSALLPLASSSILSHTHLLVADDFRIIELRCASQQNQATKSHWPLPAAKAYCSSVKAERNGFGDKGFGQSHPPGLLRNDADEGPFHRIHEPESQSPGSQALNVVDTCSILESCVHTGKIAA